MKDMIRYVLVVVGCAAALSHAGSEPRPLLVPSSEDFTAEDAARFNTTAKEVLAPAYPYMAEHVVDRFGLDEKQGIGIDLGGGPGDLILELCRRTTGFYWIDADINPHFFAYLYEGAERAGYAGRVGAVFADAQRLPFRDDYADIVVSRGSFQFWQDREQAFAEIYRVLKPGGHGFIGRGFTPNMPLEKAKGVRKKQGGKMPKYDPEQTAKDLEALMKVLGIQDYEVVRPKAEQDEVSYGVWVVFAKPGD